jgi:hypothetical protein
LAWRAGIMLHDLSTHSASLEEAFVESTEGHLEFSGCNSPAGGSPKEGERP